MGVANFNQIDGVVELFGEETPEDCSFCGKPLSGFTAYWHGLSCSGGNGFDIVALHPDCAVELAAHLSRDGLNAKFLSEGKSPAAGIPADMRRQ